MIVHRRVTYKLYPSAAQATEMERVCNLHRDLYNAALQERIDAWRKAKISIRYIDQCKSLTQIRRNDPSYLKLNAQSCQVTLKRLDLAFDSFFRRVKSGQEPGFPRFKSRDRFAGFGFKSHGDGFRFTPGENWRNGSLRLSGVGVLRAEGIARTPGRVVSGEVQRKADGWFLSIVVACEPHRERVADRIAGLDWGVETFATLAYGIDEFSTIPNDRLLRQEQENLKERQRALSKALRGKRSKEAAKKKRHFARLHRKVANRRKDRNHKTTAMLAAGHAVLITEKLTVRNMTASAKGTVERPGKNVAQKAGLNRAILDTAPGGWLSLLTCKVEETGGQVILKDPRKYRPSQTDPISGLVRKKALSERTHTLPDGRVIGRDEASALVLLRLGLEDLGRVSTWMAASETEARAA